MTSWHEPKPKPGGSVTELLAPVQGVMRSILGWEGFHWLFLVQSVTVLAGQKATTNVKP